MYVICRRPPAMIADPISVMQVDKKLNCGQTQSREKAIDNRGFRTASTNSDAVVLTRQRIEYALDVVI